MTPKQKASAAKGKIKFELFGNPKTLKRHRRRGGSKGHYDPSAGDKADFLALAHQHRPDKPFEGPLRVRLWFVFPRPKSHYGTGKKAGVLKGHWPEIYHAQTPDIDNLMKFVCDALNGVFWKDDRQIAVAQVHKNWGDAGMVEVEIEEL